MLWKWSTVAWAITVAVGGCTMISDKLPPGKLMKSYPPGTIISAAAAGPVSYEDLLDDLAASRVVYIGEIHTDPAHHQIQRRLIETLHGRVPDLTVGMEMFAFPYQPILKQWSEGTLDEQRFLEKTHWYANWRYRFDLYKDILDYVGQKGIPLVGLNIPFHIPAKVRVGGLDNLLETDRKYLPAEIDTRNPEHRTYMEPIFERHNFGERVNFEYFYEAQCLWEETMAESIARQLGNRFMVVLVGNGHIIYKFGIPDRAYRRTAASFRTLYLAPAQSEFELDYADYIWVTPRRSDRP
jgi:uncharacterized iron-regulated protein